MVENRVEGENIVRRLLLYLICRSCGRGGIEPIRLSLGHNAERRHAGVQRMTVPLYILLGACYSANVVCL